MYTVSTPCRRQALSGASFRIAVPLPRPDSSPLKGRLGSARLVRPVERSGGRAVVGRSSVGGGMSLSDNSSAVTHQWSVWADTADSAAARNAEPAPWVAGCVKDGHGIGEFTRLAIGSETERATSLVQPTTDGNNRPIKRL